MNRREFLERMFALGLVAAAPKIIFDLGANSYKADMFTEWHWIYPDPNKDPFRIKGYFYTSSKIGIGPQGVMYDD